MWLLKLSNRIYVSNNKSFSVEQFILLAEIIIIGIYMISEFFFSHISIYILLDIIHFEIQLLICWSSMYKIICMQNLSNTVKFLFNGTVIVFQTTYLIYQLHLVVLNEEECNTVMFGDDWTVKFVSDGILGLMICFSALYLTINIKKNIAVSTSGGL